MHYHVSCRQIANLSPEGAFRKLRNTPSDERSANGCCIYCFAPPPLPKKNVGIGIIILVILLIITTSLICVRWSQKKVQPDFGKLHLEVSASQSLLSVCLCVTLSGVYLEFMYKLQPFHHFYHVKMFVKRGNVQIASKLYAQFRVKDS